MPDRLSGEDGRHIIRNRRKGVPASRMARDLDVSSRHVRRLWAGYRKTGDTRVAMGRPRDCTTEARIRPVADAYGERPVGAVRVARALRKNHDTSYGRACRILKKNGMVAASAAKSGRRKWVRYGRAYANAMWHTDWHAMKDPRFCAHNLITYIDDAPGCATGAALFENAVMPPRLAIGRFGRPASIPSDSGPCFVGRNGRKKGPMGTWRPTVLGRSRSGGASP